MTVHMFWRRLKVPRCGRIYRLHEENSGELTGLFFTSFSGDIFSLLKKSGPRVGATPPPPTYASAYMYITTPALSPWSLSCVNHRRSPQWSRPTLWFVWLIRWSSKGFYPANARRWPNAGPTSRVCWVLNPWSQLSWQTAAISTDLILELLT